MSTFVRFATLSISLAVVSCSSSQPPVSCEVLSVYGSPSNCDCDYLTANKGNKSPNDVACGVAALGASTVCGYTPSTNADVDSACTCFTLTCDVDSPQTSVVCGYFRENDGRTDHTNISPASLSACAGKHYCYTPQSSGMLNSVCSCQDAPCATGAQELPSCTDGAAIGMMQQSVIFDGDTAVSDCRDRTSVVGTSVMK